MAPPQIFCELVPGKKIYLFEMKRLARSPFFDRSIIMRILESATYSKNAQTREIIMHLWASNPELQNFIRDPALGRRSLKMASKQLVSYVLTMGGFTRRSVRIVTDSGTVHLKVWRIVPGFHGGMDLDQRADWVMATINHELARHEQEPQTLDDLI